LELTGKTDFTPEEWWLLRETPLRVGAAVMVAAPSGTSGTLHEIIANATALANASKSFPDSDLIKALTEPEDKEQAYQPVPAAEGDSNRHVREERVKKDTLDMCRRVADLLDRKLAAEAAREYRQWVLQVGSDVASAAEEGGILRIGAKTISAPEVKMLTEIAAALRFSSYTPPKVK
jgi:hypothetical protein